MKKSLLKILTRTILIVFLFFSYSTGANAALFTKTLGEDTKLIPPGVMSVYSMPVFKKGTTVTLNENGEVIEGILASDPWLNCVSFKFKENGKQYFKEYGYVFREGTKVTFNDKGEVIKGTFSHNHNMNISVPIGPRSDIALKPLSEVSFHTNGVLASGTISFWHGIFLRPIGWQQIGKLTDNTGGFVKFKDGTVIELNDNGEVIKGTLNSNTNLLSPIGVRVFEEGTTVEFDDKGIVINALK